MGLLRTDLISSEGQAESITGGLIRTSIEATKLELGVGSTVFQTSFKNFGKLATTCWIMHSWKFMNDFGIKLIEGTTALKLRRVGDAFLIEQFHQHGHKGKELLRLNRCRLFLQVTTLVDISSADGKFITHKAWQGQFDYSSPSYYNWPNQGDPPPKDWALWRKALSISFCGGQTRRLTIPMGSWSDNQIDKWKWFFAPTEDRLYERLATGWNVYSMEGGRVHRENKRFTFSGYTDTIPTQLL